MCPAQRKNRLPLSCIGPSDSSKKIPEYKATLSLFGCMPKHLTSLPGYSEIDLCAPFARIRSPTLKDMAEKGIGKLLVIFPFCAETKQNGSELPIPSRLIRMRSMFQLKSHASSIKRIVRKIIKLILTMVLMLYC